MSCLCFFIQNWGGGGGITDKNSEFACFDLPPIGELMRILGAAR